MGKRKVLITGGAGYVGSVLVGSLLKGGYTVRVLDNLMHSGDGVLPFVGDPDYEFIKGDIRDHKCVVSSLEDVSAIVHLAAIVGDPASKKLPKETVEINRDASLHLIKMAQERGVQRFIFFSTCSNYGIADVERLSDERTPLKPISLYAETKVAVERHLLEQKSPGFSPLILRVSTVFGPSPRMRFDLTVNQFVMEALRDLKIIVFSPKAWRPYIHIRDVGEAVNACLKAPEEKIRGEVFNLGSNDMSHTKMAIAELTSKYLPGTEVEVQGAGKDLRDYRVDFGKWARTFSFVPQRKVDLGINEVRLLLKEWKVIPDPSLPKYYNA
ncbi:MAG: NAD(P)-dependent oxidoreductase [Candidatus Aminicenantales bacterium]